MRHSLIKGLSEIIPPILQAARIPGAVIAVAMDGRLVFAEGYGYRDLQRRLPTTRDTVYPIASTSKAMNAVLIGTLVDEGKLDWDAPVQRYLPGFRLGNAAMSSEISIRDLVTMRTGLPRHDWLWFDNPDSRPGLVSRLAHLELSAGFRERFQYNNLTVTAAGHIAEVVTGQRWEDMVRRRLFDPLDMSGTGFASEMLADNVTVSYHENSGRQLLVTRPIDGAVTAPSGGAIFSTVADMAKWMIFNLSAARNRPQSLVRDATLAEIHLPQILVGRDPSGLTPQSAYAMGWFVDVLQGRVRLWHGGYHNDVDSEVLLSPAEDIGIVAFTNFGPPGLARLIAQQALDYLTGSISNETVTDRLNRYEQRISAMSSRKASVKRIADRNPSHSLASYMGVYVNTAYGQLTIGCNSRDLILRRYGFTVPMQHWHFDTWLASESDEFCVHMPHAFDATNPIGFYTGFDGEVTAVSLSLEPSVAPIRFAKL